MLQIGSCIYISQTDEKLFQSSASEFCTVQCRVYYVSRNQNFLIIKKTAWTCIFKLLSHDLIVLNTLCIKFNSEPVRAVDIPRQKMQYSLLNPKFWNKMTIAVIWYCTLLKKREEKVNLSWEHLNLNFHSSLVLNMNLCKHWLWYFHGEVFYFLFNQHISLPKCSLF